MGIMQTLRVIVLIFGIIAYGGWAEVAWGHVFLNHAEPPVGATVTSPPTHVRIWFNGALEPAFSTIMVEGEDGKRVDKGDGCVAPSDPTLLETSLTALTPGTYRVIWSVVARDGHRTKGDYTFRVR